MTNLCPSRGQIQSPYGETNQWDIVLTEEPKLGLGLVSNAARAFALGPHFELDRVLCRVCLRRALDGISRCFIRSYVILGVE